MIKQIQYTKEANQLDLTNALAGLAGLIMTIGLTSVLIQGFALHKKPKEMDEELKNLYVPELLRKKKEKSGDKDG